MSKPFEYDERTRRALDQMGYNPNHHAGIMKAVELMEDDHRAREFVGKVRGADTTQGTEPNDFLRYRITAAHIVYGAADMEVPAHYRRMLQILDRRRDVSTMEQLEDLEWSERKLTMPTDSTETKTEKAPRAKATEPREGSKTAKVLEMVSKEGGATLAEIAKEVGGSEQSAKIILTQDLKKYNYAVTKAGEGAETRYSASKA